MSEFQCMAASVKPLASCFQSSHPCFGVKQPLMPTQISYSRSTSLFSVRKKQNGEHSSLLRYLKIKAFDAAQHFDNESKESEAFETNNQVIFVNNIPMLYCYVHLLYQQSLY